MLISRACPFAFEEVIFCYDIGFSPSVNISRFMITWNGAIGYNPGQIVHIIERILW